MLIAFEGGRDLRHDRLNFRLVSLLSTGNSHSDSVHSCCALLPLAVGIVSMYTLHRLSESSPGSAEVWMKTNLIAEIPNDNS